MKRQNVYLLAGAAAVGAYLLFSKSEGPAVNTSLRINPYTWARDKQSMLARWNAGVVGDTIRRLSPMIWPGVPYEAFLGFAANGSIRGETSSDTALPPPYGVNNSFHELGLFGTEGGNRIDSTMGTFPGIPVPVPLAPAPTMSNNSWRSLASSARVVNALGRPASLELNGWLAVPDQVAVGLANLKSHLASTISSGLSGAGPVDQNSLWALALAFGGWSAGSGRMAQHVRRYASQIQGVSDDAKWGAFLNAVANDPNTSGQSHSNPAYTAMRTWQKLEAGREISGRPDWFSTQLPNEASVATAIDAKFKAAGGR